MLTPRFFILMQDSPIDPGHVARRLKRLCSIFACGEQQGWHVRLTCSRNIALAWMGFTFPNLRIPLHHAEGNHFYAAAQLPLGMSAYVTNTDMLSGAYLKKAWDMLPKNRRMACAMCPPQVYMALDTQRNYVRLFIDYLGFSRVYEHTTPKTRVWTNFAPMLPFATGQNLAANREGWASYAGARTFIRGLTPYDNVEELRHGAFFYADGDTGKVAVGLYANEVFDFKSKVPVSALELEDASQALTRFIKDYDCCIEGTLSVDLTGGRDSRVIAAHAIAAGVDCTFRTVHPPQLELDIAKELMRLTGLEHRHVYNAETPRDIAGKRRALHPEVEDILGYYKTYYYADFCGSNIANRQNTTLNKVLSGATGELVQANSYSSIDVRNGVLSATRLKQYFHSFIDKNIFISNSVKNTVRRNIEHFVELTNAAGLHSAYSMDCILASMVHGRLFVKDTMTQGVSFSPVYAYAQSGFAMPVADKLRDVFQRTITGMALPVWKNVPYFHETAKPHENRYFSYRFCWEDAPGRTLLSDLAQKNGEYADLYVLASLTTCAQRNTPVNEKTIGELFMCNATAIRLFRHVAHDIFLQEINALANRMTYDIA